MVAYWRPPEVLPAYTRSYFHRVLRTQGSGNPICHIDIAPWGEEVAEHLQCLQDRTRTETYVPLSYFPEHSLTSALFP